MKETQKLLVITVVVYYQAIRNTEHFKDPRVQSIYKQAVLSVLPLYFPEDK